MGAHRLRLKDHDFRRVVPRGVHRQLARDWVVTGGHVTGPKVTKRGAAVEDRQRKVRAVTRTWKGQQQQAGRAP